MRTRTTLAALALAVTSVAAQAEVTPEQLQALSAQVDRLEADRQKTDDRIQINGFMSVGAGMTDARDFSYDGLDNRASFGADSVVGLQVAGKVNDNTRAVVQLVGRGADQYVVNADWAYVAYKPTRDDEFRLGRQRAPFFMLSEYLDVGYAYPWARPPVEVYIPSMPSSVDAVSWRHTFNTGDWSHSAQALFGAMDLDVNGLSFTSDDAMAVSWVTSHGDWQLNASYLSAEDSVSSKFLDGLAAAGVLTPMDQKRGWYGSLGGQYDNGSLLVMAEATRIVLPGFMPDSDQQYVTVGYRFGKFMPHLTWASSQVTDRADRAPKAMIPLLCAGPGTLCLDPAGTVPFPADTLARMMNSAQDSATLGVRYDLRSNVALKLDWTHTLDYHGTSGGFTRKDQNVFYGARPDEDANIYRLVVNVVF